MQPQLPISVDETTGIWTTDGLPMIYVPRHFFVNNHVEAEAAIGRETYAASLYKAGYRSAYFWCEQESRTHGLQGLAVYEHYLKRLSQRVWGLFSFDEVDAATGHARIRLDAVPDMRAAQCLHAELGFREISPCRHNPAAGARYREPARRP